MGTNNRSIHILRGNKNDHPDEKLDSGQPFYDKYGRSIYIGDGNTSLSALTPISGGWDKLAYEESQNDLIYYISASTLINKIKSAGFLRCTDSDGNTVGLGGLFVDGSSNPDHAYVEDRWNLIYVTDPSNHNLGGILAIGDTKGVFYGKITSTTSIEWVRLTAPNSLSYTYLNGSNKQTVTSLTLGKDSLVPSSPSSVNLGSTSNMWGTIFADNLGSKERPIDNLYLGTIVPYSNNEINFDLQGDEVENIYFCRSNSTNQIKNYKFMDGKDPYNTYDHYASIESAAKDIATQNFNTSSSYMFSNGGTAKENPGGIKNLTIPAFGQGVYIKRPTNMDGAIWITDSQLERAGTRFYYINNGEARLSPIEALFFNATSDKRLKENIVPFTSEKSILDLPVYTFNFKSDKNKKKHVGCLAQDLQEICPDLVNEDSQGYLSIEESKITYLLLEEVKELKKQVEELKGKINELEGK